MNIGNDIVSSALREKSLRPFIRAGMTKAWLHSRDSGARDLFPDADFEAYDWLLRYWDKHKKVPDLETFQQEFTNLP